MLSEAKKILDAADCTLVVVNGDTVRKCYQRGVADLVDFCENEPELLNGASVADKIIGKAAAALMIKGGVKEVYTRVITHDAAEMFRHANIALRYDDITDMVINRTKTGRCPIDTICAPLSDIDEMVTSIKDFINSKK